MISFILENNKWEFVKTLILEDFFANLKLYFELSRIF